PTAAVHADLARYALVQLMLPGDVNRDGKVDIADVSAMMNALDDLNAYEASHNLTNVQIQQFADLNGDGRLTDADIQGLIDLLANGGGTGGGSITAVPEPPPLMLLAAAGVILIAFRARYLARLSVVRPSGSLLEIVARRKRRVDAAQRIRVPGKLTVEP